MALKLKGSTSGFTAIDAPAVAGDNTLVLPANNGSASQYLQTNGSGVLSWATVSTPTVPDQVLTYPSTAVLLNGLTELEFTNIPTDVKRITIQIYAVSCNGSNTGALRFTAGTGGTATTTGYAYVNSYASSSNISNNAAYIPLANDGFTDAAHTFYGLAIFESINQSDGTRWVCQSNVGSTTLGSNSVQVMSGGFSLTGALDYMRFYPQGTSWDTGYLNILYEG